MANVTERRDKNGALVSFRIRVSRGTDAHGRRLKPFEATFKADPNRTERQNQKAAATFAADFERRCREGLVADHQQKFETYGAYWLELQTSSGNVRPRTAERYRALLVRINAAIGHIKLGDIRPQHLNELYQSLAREGERHGGEKAVILPAVNLKDIYLAHGFHNAEAFCTAAGCSVVTIRAAARGERIRAENAQKIAQALEMPVTRLFKLETDTRPLSAKTIKHHHALISSILESAVHEGLIVSNPAARAVPPKVRRASVQYFEPQDVARILQALEIEPLKWHTILHLLIVTGCRRGEVLGLKWSDLDTTFKRLHVQRALYYTAQMGVFVSELKTDSSDRLIALPPQTMELLDRYRREYYEPLRQAAGDLWEGDDGFIFVSDCDHIGRPMHPDSVTAFCNAFSKRHGLPHIHPHAFRHTAASILIHAGLDPVSVAGQLGHASAATTENIYAHMIADAKTRAANAMGEILLTSRRSLHETDDSTEADENRKHG